MLQSKRHTIDVHSAMSDEQATCKRYCATHKAAWDTKCKWENGHCAGCASCPSGSKPPAKPPPSPGAECKDYCAEHKAAWESKCTWKSCSGCASCPSGSKPPA